MEGCAKIFGKPKRDFSQHPVKVLLSCPSFLINMYVYIYISAYVVLVGGFNPIQK